MNVGDELLSGAIMDAGKREMRSGGYGFSSLSGVGEPDIVEAVALSVREATKSRTFNSEQTTGDFTPVSLTTTYI